MPLVEDHLVSKVDIVNLPNLSANFPSDDPREVQLISIVNTLKDLVDGKPYAVIVEGAEGAGKTTLLSQFVRKIPLNALSIFISASNRLSYDPDLIRTDLMGQVYWAVTGDPIPQGAKDPAHLKTYYVDLQRAAKKKKCLFYFVIDGVDELEELDRNNLLQHLRDILPIGIPQFKFLFSGDESHYRSLFDPKLIIKSFQLTQFGIRETQEMFGPQLLTDEMANDLLTICRGLPGRIAGALRASEKGVTIEDIVRDAPTQLPEFFEIDWKQVNQKNRKLIRILALLVHDLKPHTIADVSAILKLDDQAVMDCISTINFLVIEPETNDIHFVSEGLRRFVAAKLSGEKPEIIKLIIKRLMASPPSAESELQLPEYLEAAGEHTQLLDFLTPEVILQSLERSQTLSRVDNTVKRGFRSAKLLGRDADLLRFGIQKAIIADLASAYPWQSEVAALVALRLDNEALALANDAALREDRLQMLATLAHGIWVRGDNVQPELIEQIRLLVDNLDFVSLGQRAGHIASELTCVCPELAITLLKKAKWGGDERGLDQAFVHLTVSAIRDLGDERRRDQAIEIASRTRQTPNARGWFQGVIVLLGKLSSLEVIAKSDEIVETDARISVLRHWCLIKGTTPDADQVAVRVINLAVSTPSSSIDAGFLADVSTALVGAPNTSRKKELIELLDGIKQTAERLGPSVDFVRLQLSIALSEAALNGSTSEKRLVELQGYIECIADLPSRGEAYALIIGTLKEIQDHYHFSWVEALVSNCSSDLETLVLELSASTADHHAALGGVIAGLAFANVEKALDYTKVVNTERRRDAVLVDVVQSLLRRPITLISPENLHRVLNEIANSDELDEALFMIMDRYALEAEIDSIQLNRLMPIISRLPGISDSVLACRSLVYALKLINCCSPQSSDSIYPFISSSLHKRWEQIDIGWLKIDAGFGISKALASIDLDAARKMFDETELLKSTQKIAAPRPASAYVLCVRLVIRAMCGLLPGRLETKADLDCLAALIDILPSYGERAVLWSDLCMRASRNGRTDLTEALVSDRLQPALDLVSSLDAAYRARVIVQVAPALYRAQPQACLELVKTLSLNDKDFALREIIRFLLSGHMPLEPVDINVVSAAEVRFETLLQVETLTNLLETDWMIYATTEDVASCINSVNNKNNITTPQKEDVSRRFYDIAVKKLPSARYITHSGFSIVTCAKALSMRMTKPPEWHNLIAQAKRLDNVADRVYVLQTVGLCLPKSMSAARVELLVLARQQISHIPWDIDQIERYLGLAEKLHNVDSKTCLELVRLAAEVIARSRDDVGGHRRRLVDIAYRIDEEFAKSLIASFDDDEAKRRAKSQIRLFEAKKSIIDSGGMQDPLKSVSATRSVDVSKLGLMLVRSLNAGRFQSYHPSLIRECLELAADQPLDRASLVSKLAFENRLGQPPDRVKKFLQEFNFTRTETTHGTSIQHFQSDSPASSPTAVRQGC